MVKRFTQLILLCCLAGIAEFAWANEHKAEVVRGHFAQTAEGYEVDAELSFRLSNKAREALHKGVPLNWLVLVELQERDGVWREIAVRRELTYQLQYHALLNQYSVKAPRGEERFLSLNAALSYMNTLHEQMPSAVLDEDAEPPYQLAVKIQFNHDLLPVPLRPFAYLEHRWDLSSDWYIWPQE